MDFFGFIWVIFIQMISFLFGFYYSYGVKNVLVICMLWNYLLLYIIKLCFDGYQIRLINRFLCSLGRVNYDLQNSVRGSVEWLKFKRVEVF